MAGRRGADAPRMSDGAVLGGGEIMSLSLDRYRECGEEWDRAAREAEALERHDREHWGDPIQWWQDCEICAERVEELNLKRSLP